ncbi:MAG: TonB-dependent receptor [Nitrosomonadales bacterium]|nr:TonB-dependent receptor [Nitrosomonadales bacterium]
MRFFAIFRQRSLLPLLLALSAGDGLAASDAPSEQDYMQELPVVLSASRLSQPLPEAPNAVTVIDRTMIKASGFRMIADLFRLVPGMYVSYVDGHTPIVAYHGATDQYSRRMQVLVDGRSVYLPPTSSVDWEDIPLQIDDIERIEVVRGPAAASHGANSFQGVINIITRDASSLSGAEVSISKGGGGVSDLSAHLGRLGTDLDFRLTAGYRADNGFPTSVLNDSYNTRLASLRANYHPNTSDNFDFQLGYSEGVRGMGIAGRGAEPFRDAKAVSSFQQLTWLRALPQLGEFRLNYYHTYRCATDDSSLLPSPNDTHVDRHELELQHTAKLGADNRLVWGGGIRADAVDNPVSLPVAQSVHQSRLFAHDEWGISRSALLNVGAMLENDGMGHSNLSPRISLNYHFTPRHTLRVGASVAYRNPATLEEKISQPGVLVSLGGLRPEKIVSKEIGYFGELDSIGVEVDARLYVDRVSDVIFYDPTPLFQPPLFSVDGKPYSFRNLMSTDFKGAETTIKYHWSEDGKLVFNYARQMASCSVTGTLREPLFLPLLQKLATDCSLMVPWNSGSILLSQKLRHDIWLSAGYYQQEGLKIINTYMQPTLRRVDFRIAKTLSKSEVHAGGEVALVVQNAFRDNYTEYSYAPQTDSKVNLSRRAYLTATFNF